MKSDCNFHIQQIKLLSKLENATLLLMSMACPKLVDKILQKAEGIDKRCATSMSLYVLSVLPYRRTNNTITYVDTEHGYASDNAYWSPMFYNGALRNYCVIFCVRT